MLVDAIEQDVVRTVMKETKGEGVDMVIVNDTGPALLGLHRSVRRAGCVWLAGYYYSPFKVRADVGPSEGAVASWIGPGVGHIDPSMESSFPASYADCLGKPGTEGVPLVGAAELIQAGKWLPRSTSPRSSSSKTAEGFALTTDDHDQIKVVINVVPAETTDREGTQGR